MFRIAATGSIADRPGKLAQVRDSDHYFVRTCMCTLHLPCRQRRLMRSKLLKEATSFVIRAPHDGCPLFFVQLTTVFSNEVEQPVRNCVATGRS